MAEKQASKLTESAKAALPWRKGIPWGWVLAEGIVMLGLGLFMVFAEAQTRLAFGIILAIALGVSGALQLLAAWRSKQAGAESPLGWIRGGIGLGIGLLALILILASALSLLAGRIILGIGALAYGGLGGYMLYLKRQEGVRLPEMLGSTFFVLIGLLLIIAAFGGGLMSTIAVVASVLLMLFGAFLILWSLVLRSQKKAAPVA
jgi:uncharacterized membrane protein HdeD (DUF308 family)